MVLFTHLLLCIIAIASIVSSISPNRHSQRYNTHFSHFKNQTSGRSKVGIVKLKSGQGWNCPFNADSCGIRNQAKMPHNFTLMPKNNLFGKRGLFYLDMSNCRQTGARLITPYFTWNQRIRAACLSFHYIFFGNGITEMFLIKQDKSNKVLWFSKPSIIGEWQQAQIDVPIISGEPVRFFIEVHFVNQNANRMGFLAISQLTVSDSYCRH